jgi:hypothetical protein
LNLVINELIFAYQKKARLTTLPEWDLLNAELREKYSKQLIELDRIYYGAGEENDEITSRVEQVVVDIERTCRKIIESQGTLYAIFNARFRRS